MSVLAYLGAIWAINVREGRGADRAEIRKYAIKAGYRNGREVNGYSNGKNPATVWADDGRRVLPAGVDWIKNAAKQLELTLPDDLL